jgi:hypothetical protein
MQAQDLKIHLKFKFIIWVRFEVFLKVIFKGPFQW